MFELQQKSTDYELDLGAKLFIDAKIGAPRQKFVSIIKSFYDSGIYEATKKKKKKIFLNCDTILFFPHQM